MKEIPQEPPRPPELSEDQVIQRVIELQRLCKEYVKERTPEKLLDLYHRGLLKIGKNPEGEIVASLCEIPLDSSKGDLEKGQMFHIGGLATTKTSESTRVLIKMLRELKEDMERLGTGIVTSTKNETLAKFMMEMGLEKMSPRELLSKHPAYLDLFRADTQRTREYYLEQEGTKNFYVHVPGDPKETP